MYSANGTQLDYLVQQTNLIYLYNDFAIICGCLKTIFAIFADPSTVHLRLLSSAHLEMNKEGNFFKKLRFYIGGGE